MLMPGDNVFVRSNTGIDYIGQVVSIDGPFTLTLDKVSWISESGRFGSFHRTGVASEAAGTEIEFIGDGWTINWSAVRKWPHQLFMEDI